MSACVRGHESTELASDCHNEHGADADGMQLERDGESIFLNGINLAWISYGSDFNTSAAVS